MNDEKAYLQIKNKINQITFIPSEQMDALLPLLSKAFYKKHEYFVRVGEEQPNIGYVVSGLFRLFYIDLKGKEYTKNFALQGDFVMVYNSVLQSKPSNLFVQALKDSEVILIDYNEWLKLADSHICWQIVFRKMTEYSYLQKEKRESDLLFYDAETRYHNFIKDYPGLDNEIKQHYIASFLGMSPETLSRIKKIDKCQ